MKDKSKKQDGKTDDKMREMLEKANDAKVKRQKDVKDNKIIYK